MPESGNAGRSAAPSGRAPGSRPARPGSKGRAGNKRKRRDPLNATQREIVMAAALERLVHGLSPEDIAAEIHAATGIDVSREAIYPLLKEGRKRGMLFYCPPQEKVLSDALRSFPCKGEIEVVNSFGRYAQDSVAEYGAKRAVDLIDQIATGRQRKGEEPVVHLAFGVGRMAHNTVRFIAARMQARLGTGQIVPRLVVHAMSPSYSWLSPLDSPQSACGDLFRAVPDLEFVNLAAQQFVDAEAYGELKRDRATEEAFARAGEIDIVITSLADREDEHGYLRGFLQTFGAESLEHLEAANWRGDVHLCPYSATGPLEIERGPKPVTLFQYRDLVELAARPDKYVIMLCAPCGYCDRNKSAAMLPTLSEPSLRCWSHLVLDRATALDLRKRLGVR